MQVWIVTICTCDEYGCMEFGGVFSTEEKAHEWAKSCGLQCEEEGDCYNFRTDYYEVHTTQVY